METIGRFEVVEVIGEGALGVTYKGRDPDDGKDVIIKVSRGVEYLDLAIERVRKYQAFTHRSLAKVIGVGEHAGELYVVSEFVPGQRLTEWLLETRGPGPRRKVLLDVARGLNAAHKHGVLHRDVKPENIRVKRDGAGVLVDFGFASAKGLADSPRYLAPEATPSPWADQYAWWVIVGEVLGRKGSLNKRIEQGTSTNPKKRYPSMDVAAMRLKGPGVSTLRITLGVVIGLVVMGAIGVATKDKSMASKLTATEKCAGSATTDWRRMRIPVIGKLGMAGADTRRVIEALDERTLRTSQVQREVCEAKGDPDTRACVDRTWQDFKALYPGLTAASPETIRKTVDQLPMLTSPRRCSTLAMPKIAARSADADTRTLDRYEVAVWDDDKQAIAKLRAMGDRIATDDLYVQARWHFALADALSRTGEDGDEALAEAALALKQSSTDGRLHVRAMALTIEIANKRDPAFEKTADEAASDLDNPAVTAELLEAEAVALANAADHEHALDKYRLAESTYSKVAVDNDASSVVYAQRLGAELVETGDYDAAYTVFERAYKRALARYGAHDGYTLQIRQAKAANETYRANFAIARRELVATIPELEDVYGAVSERVADARLDLCLDDLADQMVTTSCADMLAVMLKLKTLDDDAVEAPFRFAGRALLLAQRPADAIAPLESSLALCDKRRDANLLERPRTVAYLAIALHQAHRDPERARKLYREAKQKLSRDSDSEVLDELEKGFAP